MIGNQKDIEATIGESPVVEELSADIEIVRDVERQTGTPCVDCGRRLCGHRVLFSIVLGFKNAARCLGCFAKHLDQAESEICDQLCQLIHHRDCYRQAWEAAGKREGFSPGEYPPCLPNTLTTIDPPGASTDETKTKASVISIAAEWDAGDMGCGDLVLALRIRMQKLAAGSVLKVLAYDPAAPLDLPAWCRLTGHPMIQAAHPEYLIERKRG